MHQKNSQKTPFIIIIALMIINVLLLFGTYMWVQSYNRRERVADFSKATWEDSKLIFSDFTLDIKPREGDSSAWLKDPIYDDEGNELHGASVGTIYEFTISNTSKATITNWKLEIQIPELLWINNAWNGLTEIIQHRETGELRQTIDFKNYSNTVVELDYYTDHTGPMITMNIGDSFNYYPDEEEIMITPKKSEDDDKYQTTSGIIMYFPEQTIDYATKFDIGKIYYQLHTSIWANPAFLILIFTMLILVIFLLGFVISYIRIRKLLEQQKHDAQIIEQAISTFVNFIDAKDANTKGHSERVAKYSYLLAKEMGFSDIECNRIYYIGLMHDCGKISIPFTILEKPSKLTNEEYELIKEHTIHGDRMLRDFTSIEGINLGALYHHERYDGTGYPQGLAGEDIPLIARIICVADSLDAMNSNRLYRKRLEKEVILSELINNKGKQFDPYVVECVLKLIRENVINISS